MHRVPKIVIILSVEADFFKNCYRSPASVRMRGPLRNKQGCWTCRLRKKKCDGGRPHCLLCESLLITCYGFGPRPDWMDNGEKEKEVANSLKDIVKYTSRRKAATQSSKHNATITIAPKSSNDSLERSSSISGSHRQGTIPSVDHGSSPEQVKMVQSASAVSTFIS